jgi:hypothetical protein
MPGISAANLILRRFFALSKERSRFSNIEKGRLKMLLFPFPLYSRICSLEGVFISFGKQTKQNNQRE